MNLAPPVTRCDLHLHSDASQTTGQWFSQYFEAPESYADPLRQYELCKARGMSLVTLTDHDTIDGGLKLLGRPDFFLSVEVSTVFPENDCAVHVLVYDITPAQHLELQRRRRSVYEVCAYLRSERLAHVLPHPLVSPNWKLDAPTLEKCLVLFPAFEAINGLMDRRTDPVAGHFFDSVTPEVLAALSKKHGIALVHGTPPRLALTAGSDDHAQRRCGSVFTEVDGELDAEDFLDRVMRGDSRRVGRSGDLDAMTMCIKQSAYLHFQGGHAGEAARRNPFMDIMNSLAGRSPAMDPGSPRGSSEIVSSLLQATRLARIPAGLEFDIAHVPGEPSDASDRRFVEAVARVSDALAGQAVQSLGRALIQFDIYGLFAGLTDLGAALGVAAPHLFAADHFARQEAQVRRLWGDWTATDRPPVVEHLAVFSDASDHIDGVSVWCERFANRADACGRRVWFAKCDPADRIGDDDATPRPYPAVARFKTPFYPDFELTVPSLAATVDRLWRERTTHVEIATPGPMGCVGLAAARLMRLPVTASYHTDIAEMIQVLIGDPKLARLVRQFLGWFYRSVDRVFVFSDLSRDKLLAMGVSPEKIETLPVAVDPDDFSPSRSSPTAFSDLGLALDGRPVVLSVGRISAEKNIPSIVEAVGSLQDRPLAPCLVVVGDGPELARLRAGCRDQAWVRFVGPKEGKVLRELYASADVFVFASAVDTLGLVNLEALSSGVPLVVPAGSAIAESLSDGHDALFFGPGPGGLADALRAAMDDPDRTARIRRNGRQHMLDRWKDAEFDVIWRSMVGAAARPPAARTPSPVTP